MMKYKKAIQVCDRDEEPRDDLGSFGGKLSVAISNH